MDRRFIVLGSQGGYGFATVILVILILALVVLEFQIDVFERMGGNLLKWSNYSRQRIGRAWEFQSASVSAMQELGQMVSYQNEIRRELQDADDFAYLPQHLSDGLIITLSREKFLDIYNELPRIYADRLGSTIGLMELIVASGWERVAFIGRNQGMDVYYLNNDNMVVSRFFLDRDYFQGLQRWGAEIPGRLEANPDFSGRTYSAAEFVYALSYLDDVQIEANLGTELLKLGDKITRVAISRRWNVGMVDLAFEMNDGRTILYPVSDNLAAQLLEYLPDVETTIEKDLP